VRWIAASLRVIFAPLLPDYSGRLERGRQQCREQSLTDCCVPMKKECMLITSPHLHSCRF
jgi:hypothetical protein